MTAYVPLLMCLAGALVYALAGNAKLCELGRIAFAAGMFAEMFALAGRAIKLLG